jgi:hypothetical protein
MNNTVKNVIFVVLAIAAGMYISDKVGLSNVFNGHGQTVQNDNGGQTVQPVKGGLSRQAKWSIIQSIGQRVACGSMSAAAGDKALSDAGITWEDISDYQNNQ